MTSANLTGTTIRRAAVRGVRLDTIAARRSTERLLVKMPETVPGMGASAVLCVRQMSVHVRSRQRHMQPGSSVLGEEMERLARHAARPVYGPVPPGAAAVLFADHAELLSCLARDYERHLLMQGWWWRVLLPGPSLAAAAMQMWVSEAAHAPAALARLAGTQDAVAFAHMLGEVEAGAVIQAMVRTHGLALLAEEISVAPLLQSHSQLISSALSKSSHDDVNTSLHSLEREIHTALPEAWAHGLSLVQRYLLAVGLSLVRLPRLVRSTAYAQALPALLEQANSEAIKTSRRSHNSVRAEPVEAHSSFDKMSANELQFSSGLITSPVQTEPVEAHTSLNEIGVNWLQYSFDRVNSDSTSLPSALPAATEVLSPTAAMPNLPSLRPLLRGHESSVALAKTGADPVAGLLDSRLRGNDGTTKTELMIVPRTSAQVASLLEAETRGVDTEYGGVFFLCNAALALNLYADFTRPLDRGLELALWDFLALAAMDLGGPAVRQDPLWPLLAELAGRAPGQRPGAGFAPPNEWRMPVEWLLPFAGEAADWTWEADAVRLVVRHPARFVVLDLLRDDMAVDEQLHVQLERYNMPSIRQAVRCRRDPATPLARWRSWVMSYLGRRVARALGDVHWRRACRMLLCLPGRIELDAERLNVHFSLERLPVVVRMAGLDRDPGWIPAAGRDVRFHFGCDHA